LFDETKIHPGPGLSVSGIQQSPDCCVMLPRAGIIAYVPDLWDGDLQSMDHFDGAS